MPDDHQKLRALFSAAYDLTPSEREAFLDRECRDDETLRAALEGLLAGDSARSDMFAEANLGLGRRLLDVDGAPGGATTREAFLPGTKISGRYRIVSLLGHGGMGDVYWAEDLKLGSRVALKFLRSRLSDDPLAFGYFINEVRLSRQVTHPNVCRVYDIGETDGRAFISMEFVDGEDLESLLRRIGRLPEDKGIEIARQLCLGLAAAHDKGVLHRDLKPANVMIDGRGQVRVTDFGLAIPWNEAGDGAEIIGTPAYMAPELLSGGTASVASDLYSLGLVLYELFTGQHAGTPPKSPSSFVGNLDPDVERVILQCLERDPRQRPLSAHAVATALPGRTPLEAALAAGETPSPELVASASDRTDFSRRTKVAVFAGILVGIVLIGFLSVRSQNLIDFDADTLIRPEDAADMTRALGYPRPMDSTWGLEWNHAYFELFQKDADAWREWERLTAAPPTAATLWRREGHVSYLASIAGHGPFGAVFVSRTDPPPLEPGMITVLLDANGRLLEFVAVPLNEAPTEQTAHDGPDWQSQLLSAAGIDKGVFESEFTLLAERNDLPPLPVYADTRISRKSRSGRIRVDMAAYQGRPVFFRLSPELEAEPPPPMVFAGILGAIVLALVATAIILGRRNWLAGRADRRGTSRMFGFILVVSFAYWVFQAHHVPGGAEAVMILKTTARTFLRAIVICAAYVGLEPYLRAWRPDTLISWNRLIRGQFRDPMVGRSILVGTLWGVVAQLIGSVGLVLEAPRQIALVAEPTLNIGTGPFDLQPLTGPISALGQMSANLFVSVSAFVWVPLLFFALRSVLRRNWTAAIAFVLIYSTSTFVAGDIHGALTIAVWVSLLLLLFFRFGILTVLVAEFTWSLLAWPISLDFAGPHLDIGLFAYALVAGLALYGLRTSLGGRPWVYPGTATS